MFFPFSWQTIAYISQTELPLSMVPLALQTVKQVGSLSCLFYWCKVRFYSPSLIFNQAIIGLNSPSSAISLKENKTNDTIGVILYE